MIAYIISDLISSNMKCDCYVRRMRHHFNRFFSVKILAREDRNNINSHLRSNLK